jgi:hypothetical protein
MIYNNLTMRFDEKARFPYILHTLLDDARKYNFEHIISWVPITSDAFVIHDPKLFAQVIMKRYFTNQNRYKSFLRQLNLYGFERVVTSKSISKNGTNTPRGAYWHPLFQRDSPDLCVHMGRPRARNSPVKLPSELKEISSPVMGRVSYPTKCRLVNESILIPDVLVDDIIWLFGPRNVSHTGLGV